MEFDKFERYVENVDLFTASEVKEFEFMGYNEMENYQMELEQSTGNLSEWDHFRALITLKHRVWEQSKYIDELESEVRLWKSNCGEFDDEDEDMEEED